MPDVIATIRVPRPLQKLSGGLEEVAVEGGTTVGGAFRALDFAFPGFAEQLFGDNGLVRRSIDVFLGEVDIRTLAGLDTPVHQGQIITIVPNDVLASAAPDSGGAPGLTKRSLRRARGMEPSGGPGRILVVDDEETIRNLLAWTFEDAGYEVAVAADGEQAVDALETEPPDCMILDLMMPRIDGAQVLLHRQKYDLAANTRIVVLTAKTGHADEVWCWEHGADEFLNKPFDADQLTRLVGQLMNMSPEDLEHRREVGLADARRMDALHAAFQVKPVR